MAVRDGSPASSVYPYVVWLFFAFGRPSMAFCYRGVAHIHFGRVGIDFEARLHGVCLLFSLLAANQVYLVSWGRVGDRTSRTKIGDRTSRPK